MFKCACCGGKNVYALEIRTDYNNFRDINPLNEGIKDITNDDLPYRLNMYYCHDCQSVVNTEESEEENV